jgi:hypothetical protein
MRRVALALFLGLALAAPASAAEPDLRARPGGSFGHAVAAAGDTLVVGDPADAGERGAVYVFQRTGDVWMQTAKLTAADGAPGDALGWSVAVSGATVVAGAPSNGDGKGAVYTFAPRGADGYAQAANLAAADGAPGDHLGLAVAIDADTIVAGAPDASAAGGAVYTFASAGEPARTETAKLTATVAAAGDQLGSSVAISGATVVAGAPGGVVGRGAVYTFARVGGPARSQTATLTASDGGPGKRLGASVAVQGDTIVAGAPDVYAGPRDNHGSLYTFAATGVPERTESAKLRAADDSPGDLLGTSVAIDGATIVAGAPLAASGPHGERKGAVYAFAAGGRHARTETAELTPGGRAPRNAFGSFGNAVAIAGDTVLTGSPGRGMAAVYFSRRAPVRKKAHHPRHT